MAADFLSVAPSDIATEGNTLRDPLRPIAIWELEDQHFAFDSSILLPSMTEDLGELVELIRANPSAPIAIFGHADPSGDEGYNKLLTGRRATALFGLLTRKIPLWEQLLAHPVGGDDWKKGDQAIRIMKEHLGKTGPVVASALFAEYMDALAVDGAGKLFGLPPRAFLGGGRDAGGKADFQGCSEFNPRLVFSAAEARRFAAPGQKEARDEANAINRRVSAILFAPGTEINLKRWPCPRASEGVAGCRKRFWSDAATRRSNQERRRERPEANDTFACRFYDRIAIAAARAEAVKTLVLRLLKVDGTPDGGGPFTLIAEGITTNGVVTDAGLIQARVPVGARTASLRVRDQTVPITIARTPPVNTVPGVQTRLANLGFFGGEIDGQVTFELREAIGGFQRDLIADGRQVEITRDPADPILQAALLERHGR